MIVFPFICLNGLNFEVHIKNFVIKIPILPPILSPLGLWLPGAAQHSPRTPASATTLKTIIQKLTINEWGQDVTRPGYEPAAGSCGNEPSGLHKLCENWLAKCLAASPKSHLPPSSYRRRQASLYLWPSSLLCVPTQQHNLLLFSRTTGSLLFIKCQVRAIARWTGAHPKVRGGGCTPQTELKKQTLRNSNIKGFWWSTLQPK